MTDDDDAPFRGEIRLVSARRVSHGLGLPKRDDLSDEEEYRRDLAAYLLVLPPGARFTHLTAARLRGWDLPKVPEQMPVFVAVGNEEPRPRRAGLVCSRVVRPGEITMCDGLPVDEPEEILIRAARDLSLLDLLILLESALQAGDVDHARIVALLESGRPGVRMLRAAWERATGKSESPGETVLQEFHRVMAIRFTPQVDVYDDQGTFLARADLLIDGTELLHEYDGEHHRRKDQQQVDLRRGRQLADSAYTRKGFVLDDLLNHPAVIMHELDRALGRPHVLRRLQRWKRLVDNSLYSEAGRERMMNRWRRQMPIADWAGTA